MRRFAIVSLLLILSVISFAQETDSRLIDAVSLYNNRDYAKSRAILAPLAKSDPDNDAVHYYLGLDEALLGNTDEALAHLSRAVDLDPENYWYKLRLADLYAAAGEDEMVIRMYESILEAYPDKIDVSYNLLSLYLKGQQLDKALGQLDDIEKVTGPDEQTARTRYDILRHQGRGGEAIAALEAFNAEFSSPSVLSMMGDYYLEDLRDSLALSCYEEALSLQGDYVPALLGRAEVFRTARRYDDYFAAMDAFIDQDTVPVEAKSMYVGNLSRALDPRVISLHQDGFDAMVDHLLERHPSDSTVLTNAGGYFYATSRQDRALDCFRTAADLYPESLPTTVSLIQLLSLAERWEEVRDRSAQAFDRFQEMGFMEFLNMADYNLKDYDAIIGNCRYILTRSGGDADVEKAAWAQIGDMYHLKGDTKQAYKAYDKALKIDPSYAPVLNNYAYYLSEEGKSLKKAYSMSKKTVEAEPDNATYLDTFAWILHLQGKDLEAKPFFKHAMLYGGKESAVILDHYAEVLYALGEYDLAKVYWTQAKARNTDGEIPDLDTRSDAKLKAVGK